MLGTGDIDITVRHPTGDRRVTLNNVSYGPNFPANLVSLKLANKSGIYWDQANSQLTEGGQTWCIIDDIDDHYVVEYQPPGSQPAALYTGKYTKSTSLKPQPAVSLDLGQAEVRDPEVSLDVEH